MPDRLIVLDLDGTLLTSTQQISARTREALAAAVASGCRIVIATGRSFSLVDLFCAGLPLNAPQITYNGAVIYDPVQRRDLWRYHVPPDLVAGALDFFAAAGIPVGFFTPDHLYMDRRIPDSHLWAPSPLPAPRRLADLRAVMHLPCLKVVGYGEAEAIAALRERAREEFGAVLCVTQTHAHLLEMLHPEVSKGKALLHLAAELGVARDDIIAFGDHHNDIEMIRAAGVGIAMGNADPALKAVATMTTDSNDQDGIATALQRLGII